MTNRIALIIESLRRYVEVDYWRTVGGRKVGFVGPEGAGVPVAGPPEYVASGADNPLLGNILEARPAGTFTGDAIRKENFPVSALSFIDSFVGDTAEAVDKAFTQIAQSIAQTKGNPDYQWLTDDDDEIPKVSMMRDKSLRYMREKAKNDPAYASVLGSLVEHFNDPRGRASIVYSFIGQAGVVGQFSDDDKGAQFIASKDDEDYASTVAAAARAIGMKGDDELLAKRFPAKVKEVLRDVYVANQLVLRAGADTGGGYVPATRGMGDSFPDMSESESLRLMVDCRSNNVPAVIAGQRSVTGASESDYSPFGGFSYVGVQVPIEATLSTYRGLRLQKLRKGGYIREERELLMIGAAGLKIQPDQLQYVE